MRNPILLFSLVGCGPGNQFDAIALPPSVSLSPSVVTAAPAAPGETQELMVQLDSTGGEPAALFYEVIQERGTGLSLTVEPPVELEVDETFHVVFTYAPTEPGLSMVWLRVTTGGNDDCNEAWAVVRAAAADTSCDPDDLDCDGQTVGAGDCDDANPYVGIAFPEVCDGRDNSCNGSIDPKCANAGCGHLPR